MPEIALNPPPFNPFSHTGRRGSLSVLMPETEDDTQGLPHAQGGLQPAPAPARQLRRGFHALREGFSPHPHTQASPRSAGIAHGSARIGRMRTDGKEHPSLKGSVLGCDARFAAFPRLLPLIPPAPFSHTGLKGGGFAGRLSTVSVPPNARADPSVS